MHNYFRIFCIIAALILYFFSYFPIRENFQQAPSERYYIGSTEYPIDLMGNLAVVIEGYLGHWERFSKTTSTIVSPPSFVKIEYIFIGQIARFFRMEPLVMFYLIRLILSITYIVFIFILVKTLFDNNIDRLIAISLSFFSTGVAISVKPWDIMQQIPLDAAVFQRLTTSMPHYLIGGITTLASIYFLAKFLDKKSTFGYFAFSSLLGFISSFVYAPSIILFLLAIPLFIVFQLIRVVYYHERLDVFRELVILILYSAITAIPFFYFRQISSFWDFNFLAKTEMIVPFGINWQNYIFVVGLTYIFAALSFPYTLKSGKTLFLFFISWVFVHPFATLFLSSYLHINSLRFFLTPTFIILSVLSSLSLRYYFPFQKDRFKRFIPLFLTVIIIASGWNSLQASFRAGRVCFCLASGFDYGYPRKEVFDVMRWLRSQTKENDIVLSSYYAGTIIPAFSGNLVYTSWWHRLMDPPNFTGVTNNIERFFSGQMHDSEALAFLRSNSISYIYFGEQEKQYLNGKGLHYSYLQKVLTSGSVDIYKVSQLSL